MVLTCPICKMLTFFQASSPSPYIVSKSVDSTGFCSKAYSIIHQQSFQLISSVFWSICDFVAVDWEFRIISWLGKGLGEAVLFIFVTWPWSPPSVLFAKERKWMSEWTLATVWRRIPPVLSRYASPSCSTRGVSDSAAKCVIVISGWPKWDTVSNLEFSKWHPGESTERTGYIMC